MQALWTLKSALELDNPSVASDLYLVYSTTDVEGNVRAEARQILMGVFTRGEDIRRRRPNGLGCWRDKSGKSITPVGEGLEGLVRVVKLDSDQKQEFLSKNGYGSVDKIVPDRDEWTRVMDAYSDAMNSKRVTYYVKDREGNLLNGGAPFSSIGEFLREVNGKSEVGMHKLRKEIKDKGLGATGKKPKWVNPDMTQHGEATWDAPNRNQYTIRSRSF
mmetsp:Transcript_15116/g.34962  ORF Transcript_15116/g.34962 Transcript_15116/m.34962 type:complete len:217 (-) Transcript_15116:30-680(-)